MKRTLGLAALLLTLASPSWALPVLYTLTFDASDVASGAAGPSGTGSFIYDDATTTMTSLSWDFGGGFAGGMSDQVLEDFDTGQLLFESIFVRAGDPFAAGTGMFPPAADITGHPNVDAAFCWGLSNLASCGMANTGTTAGSYQFVDAGAAAPLTYRGRVSAEAVRIPVPEPVSAALLLVGGGAMLARRRRRA